MTFFSPAVIGLTASPDRGIAVAPAISVVPPGHTCRSHARGRPVRRLQPAPCARRMHTHVLPHALKLPNR